MKSRTDGISATSTPSSTSSHAFSGKNLWPFGCAGRAELMALMASRYSVCRGSGSTLKGQDIELTWKPLFCKLFAKPTSNWSFSTRPEFCSGCTPFSRADFRPLKQRTDYDFVWNFGSSLSRPDNRQTGLMTIRYQRNCNRNYSICYLKFKQ